MPLTRNAFRESWRSPAILRILHFMFASESRFSGGKTGTLVLYTNIKALKFKFIQLIISVLTNIKF